MKVTIIEEKGQIQNMREVEQQQVVCRGIRSKGGRR
jgi:hypothetical protein